MAGRLDEFWPDVADSAWIGGKAEGWERGPYWLDGLIPLAAATGDARLRRKAARWVDAILASQSDDGWLGPETGDPSPDHHEDYGHLDVWPRMLVAKALLQYESWTSDARVVPALLALAQRMRQVLAQQPLHEWGRARWGDLVICLLELHERTGQPWLLEFSDEVVTQGLDWMAVAAEFPYTAPVTDARLEQYGEDADGIWMNDRFLATHGVNVAMAVRSFPALFRLTGDERYRHGFDRMLAGLDHWHGLANGMFSCDEHLAGRHPSQGSETCAVVEMLQSLEYAHEVWGHDPAIRDRLERIAYNALPAASTRDDRAHQYVQQPNQVICHVTDDRPYTNNGPDANTFGLAPHFGCCTANRHQGWPRFTARLWAHDGARTLSAATLAPCHVVTMIGGANVRIDVETQYPFNDHVRLRVTCDEPTEMTIELPVPNWAGSDEQMQVIIEGRRIDVPDGPTHRVQRTWRGSTDVEVHFAPSVILEPHGHDTFAVVRGAVLLVLPVQEEWRAFGAVSEWPSHEVHPSSDWNITLEVVDETQLNVSALSFSDCPDPLADVDTAFQVETVGRVLPQWTLHQGAAGLPSETGTRGESIRPVVLVPYATTRLRISQFPRVPSDSDP